MNKGIVTICAFLLVFAVTLGVVLAAEPYGASDVTENAESTGNGSAVTPGNHSAIAGNVTEITITGASITQAWQGYYGNVSGTIQLADSSDNIFYNWSTTDAEGEIFASTNDSISWSDVGCFALTNDSISGNLTLLESTFGIASSDADGVNETFTLNNHAGFSIATTSFSSGECNNTKVFGPNGAATFDEALMYDSGTNSTVFASILSDDTSGFDSSVHDFEMLVLEDGHSGDVSTTPYFFYVELE
ncbi:hypothetical protein GOV14_01835 [Candidatus Pacearchaeota archaeon]|nr:hypothetical protein [Candidatus Pacearchaeota archaeon]